MAGLDRDAIVTALRALLGEGAVLTEPHELARYEKGWRYGDGAALAAVRPGSTEEVSRVLTFASERGLRLVPQGANTGMVGASTPDASGEMLVLSLERLSRIVEIDPVDRTVTAEGGVLLSQLEAALAEQGLMFPIDLGADPSLGGMVSTNAAGTRVLRYGDVRHNLLGLEVVLADGTVLDLMTALRKNNTGLDAKQLFVGTSGVFGVVTRAVMRVLPRPAHRSTAFVGVADGPTVLGLLSYLEQRLGDVLSAFEVISAAALAPVFRYQSRLRSPYGAELPAYTVLVELATTLPADRLSLDELLESTLGELIEGEAGERITDVFPGKPAELWDVRHHVSESQRHEGEVLGLDISVPRSSMAAFIEAATACGRRKTRRAPRRS
jgi:FAD/FMN-containing dehydrogenase